MFLLALVRTGWGWRRHLVSNRSPTCALLFQSSSAKSLQDDLERFEHFESLVPIEPIQPIEQSYSALKRIYNGHYSH